MGRCWIGRRARVFCRDDLRVAVVLKPMAFFIDLFSPETYEAFRKTSRDVTGFRENKKLPHRK
jgi:hypothetical protein